MGTVAVAPRSLWEVVALAGNGISGEEGSSAELQTGTMDISELLGSEIVALGKGGES